MTITANEAVTEKNRLRETPAQCFACSHAFKDAEEGWVCRKFDAVIVLASGRTMEWPGQACDRAYENDCRGAGFSRSIFPVFLRKYPIIGIFAFSILFASIVTWLHG